MWQFKFHFLENFFQIFSIIFSWISSVQSLSRVQLFATPIHRYRTYRYEELTIFGWLRNLKVSNLEWVQLILAGLDHESPLSLWVTWDKQGLSSHNLPSSRRLLELFHSSCRTPRTIKKQAPTCKPFSISIFVTFIIVPLEKASFLANWELVWEEITQECVTRRCEQQSYYYNLLTTSTHLNYGHF